MLSRLSIIIIMALNLIWSGAIFKIHRGNDRIEAKSLDLWIYTIAAQRAADLRLIQLLKTPRTYAFPKGCIVSYFWYGSPDDTSFLARCPEGRVYEIKRNEAAKWK